MGEGFILGIIEEHLAVVKELPGLVGSIEEVCRVCGEAILRGNKIMLAGNGGSAADAQHLAAEFVGRFLKERRGLPAIALTTDSSILTAVGNDYGFEEVFARQVLAIGREGDVFIGLSTSGRSRNVIRAVEEAKGKGILTVGFLGGGNDGGELGRLADFAVVVPSMVTARVQEMHILIGHILCEYIDVHN